jgi:hypothetical protein
LSGLSVHLEASVGDASNVAAYVEGSGVLVYERSQLEVRSGAAYQPVAADGGTATRARRKCVIALCTCGALDAASRRR